MNKYSSYVGSA